MKILYHASSNPNLDVLEPQRTLSKDKYVGYFVFATADKMLATMYLTPKGYGSRMCPDSTPPKILICANENEIKAKDKGGAIYMVNASDFAESPQKDLRAFEKATNKPVIPLSKELIDSAFSALEEMGVEIEFIDQKTFNRLI